MAERDSAPDDQDSNPGRKSVMPQSPPTIHKLLPSYCSQISKMTEGGERNGGGRTGGGRKRRAWITDGRTDEWMRAETGAGAGADGDCVRCSCKSVSYDPWAGPFLDTTRPPNPADMPGSRERHSVRPEGHKLGGLCVPSASPFARPTGPQPPLRHPQPSSQCSPLYCGRLDRRSRGQSGAPGLMDDPP